MIGKTGPACATNSSSGSSRGTTVGFRRRGNHFGGSPGLKAALWAIPSTGFPSNRRLLAMRPYDEIPFDIAMIGHEPGVEELDVASSMDGSSLSSWAWSQLLKALPGTPQLLSEGRTSPDNRVTPLLGHHGRVTLPGVAGHWV